MKWLKNLEDLKQYVFANKERAYWNRKTALETRKPRDVYDEVCQLIADKLEESGFKYYPSKKKLELKSSDKKYKLSIIFSSNRNNVLGEFIELNAAFYISSKDFETFSKNNPLLDYYTDLLIGENFCLPILEKPGSITWNLADKKDYNEVINLIPETVCNKLIDYFNWIQQPTLVIEEIQKNNFDFNRPVITIQYLLMYNKKKIAEKYLSIFLKNKSIKVREEYEQAKNYWDNNLLPSEYAQGMGYGKEIALLEKNYKLHI
tara:strand:- start:54 stop:836 length:783 start_codon:yes stop_codon:yes gene_type:complete